jgi:hypothetical protein
LLETIRARGSATRFCDVPLIVKAAAESPHIKARLFSAGSKISPDRARMRATARTPNRSICRTAMATTAALRRGIRWRVKPPQCQAKTSRADFARQFGGKSDLF